MRDAVSGSLELGRDRRKRGIGIAVAREQHDRPARFGHRASRVGIGHDHHASVEHASDATATGTVDGVQPVGIDVRGTRFDDGVIALALLAGFAFRFAWVIPIAALLTAIGAAFGPGGAPLVRGFSQLVAGQLREATTFVEPAEWRFGVMLEAAVLALATLLVFLGLTAVAWLFGLAVAAAAALNAATGISVGIWAARRWGPSTRRPD